MDAPLSVRLNMVAATVRGLSPAFAEVIDRMVARLADNGVGVTAPRPGEPMPPFLLPDETGRLVSLYGLLNKGPVVVALSPLAVFACGECRERLCLENIFCLSNR